MTKWNIYKFELINIDVDEQRQFQSLLCIHFLSIHHKMKENTQLFGHLEHNPLSMKIGFFKHLLPFKRLNIFD